MGSWRNYFIYQQQQLMHLYFIFPVYTVQPLISVFSATWILPFREVNEGFLWQGTDWQLFEKLFLQLSNKRQKKLNNLENLSETTIQCGQWLSVLFYNWFANCKAKILLVLSKMCFALQIDCNHSVSWMSCVLAEFKGLCDLRMLTASNCKGFFPYMIGRL